MTITCLLVNFSFFSSNVCFWLLTQLYVDDENPTLKKLYKDKLAQYMSRAEYIKKNVLDHPAYGSVLFQAKEKEEDKEIDKL